MSQTTDGAEMRLRDRKKLKTRQAIIDSALGLFRERGFEATTVEQIVRRVDISQQTFFRYFPSKDAVLHDVARGAYDELAAGLRRELSSTELVATRVRRFYADMSRQVTADQALWRAIAVSGAMDPARWPDLRAVDQTTFGLLADLLAEGQRRGEITSAFAADEMAQFLEGMASTITMEWAIDLPEPHDAVDRMHKAVEFFLLAAQARPAAGGR